MMGTKKERAGRNWCTDWRLVAHHSSRWLDVLHRVGTQRPQRFILVQEHFVILWGLPDVLLSVPHEHHLLSGRTQHLCSCSSSCKVEFHRRQKAGLSGWTRFSSRVEHTAPFADQFQGVASTAATPVSSRHKC